MEQDNNFSDILNSLLQNPEIMKTVSDIAGKMNDNNQPDERTDKESSADTESTSPAEGFTVPPELLKKLPQMMSLLTGTGGTAPSTSSGTKGQGTPLTDTKRRALLNALKPYLSDKRCAVIDGLLQFEGLAGVLSAFQEK